MRLTRLPLHNIHEQHGATFSEFGGYLVPDVYCGSTIHEHNHTRSASGLFDISHKTQIEIEGRDATILLTRLCPISASDMNIGSSKYTFLLNDHAGVIDHLILMRLSLSRFLMIVNGVRADRVLAHIEQLAKNTNARVRKLNRALISLQGPKTDAVLASLGLNISGLRFMNCLETPNGYIINRSGYTGEKGVEISLTPSAAKDLVEQLLADGRVELAGQIARNSLRIEAGLCRYGSDLDETITPVESGLMKAIPKNAIQSGLFVGASALKNKLAQGRRLIRMGLTPKLGTILEEGSPIFDSKNNEIGRISSTTHGPTVGSPIAMGYVHSNIVEFGLPIFANQNEAKIPLARQQLPFLPSNAT